jgi:hypothetical protein
MKFVFSALLMLLSSSGFAECSRPDAPTLPDGEVSDLATMVEGQKAVKAYVAGTEAYLECLSEENEKSSEELAEEEIARRVEMHNAAVDDMEKVAAQFNEEIREYKAQSE